MGCGVDRRGSLDPVWLWLWPKLRFNPTHALKTRKKKKKKRCPGVSDLIKPSTETSRKLEPKLYLFICFFFFFFLKGHNCGIWKFPGWGSNQSCTCQPTPQPHKPQQLQIQAVSVHSNTRSLGPGIEHISSWIPVGFVSTEPQ